MSDAKLPYPMWVVHCRSCEWVCTIWEKPGTGCSYIKYCPRCSGRRVSTERVNNKAEHEKAMEGDAV